MVVRAGYGAALLLALLVATLLRSETLAQWPGPPTNTATCPVLSHDEVFTCFAVKDKARAEGSFRPKPIDPSQAVTQTIGVPLSEVYVGWCSLKAQQLRRCDYKAAQEIVFIFGTDAVQTSPTSGPTYAFVTETRLKKPNTKRAQTTIQARSPWRLLDTIPKRKLSLLITSNGDLDTLLSIALRYMPW